MPYHRTKYLLDRYHAGQLTPEEALELTNICNGPNAADVQEIIKQKLEVYEGREDQADPLRLSQIVSRVLSVDRPVSASDSRDGAGAPPEVFQPAHRISWHKQTWLRYAAVFIILAGAAAFYLFTGNNDPAPSQEVAGRSKKADAAPGKNGAILTLSDGTRVVLDSITQGVVASQSGARVIMQNGKLIYDPAGTGDPSINTMTTPNGRMFNLVLPDGSQVWLNAASSIRYPTFFAGKERLVEITGEVYFEVERNKKMPFRVRINNKVDVVVLGTSFNVNAYDDRNKISTTLIEGSVSIKTTGRDRTTVLKPGQQARVDGTGAIELDGGVNLDQVTAWKNDLFHFIDADLQTVMQELGRWYDMEVVYQGDITSQRFEGKIQRKLNLSDVLESLSRNKIGFRIDGKKIIVYPLQP